MIKVTTSGRVIGAEAEVCIDIDKIILLQRQTPATDDFTAIFLIGAPPYKVTETVDEVRALIAQARKERHRVSHDG